MANDTMITVVGNLTADPDLRYTPAGAAVVDFTVASTPRSFDKAANEWKDGDALFLRCSAWREYAENIAASLTKGMRVVVQGRLVQRSYTPRDGGDQRTVVELQVEEVGPALRYAKAQVVRAPRGGSQQANTASFTTPPDDPWGNNPQTPQNGTQATDQWGGPSNVAPF